MSIAAIIGAILLVGVAVAATFWRTIISWAHDSLFPWVEKNVPSLLGVLKTAFVLLDKVAVAVRVTAKEAWQRLKAILIKQVLKFVRVDGTWHRVFESWMTSKEDENKAIRITTEEAVVWEELPDDVREALVRRAELNVDVTALREQEIMSMEN